MSGAGNFPGTSSGAGGLEWWQHQIQLGNMPGHTLILRKGEIEAATAMVEAPGHDVWHGNKIPGSIGGPGPELIPAADSAGEQWEVLSSSSEDSATGTGVAQVLLHIVLADFSMWVGTVDLNGTTPVAITPSTAVHCNGMHATGFGSDAANTGVANGQIIVRKVGDTDFTYNMLRAGGNESLVPNFMVPADSKLLLKGFYASESQGRRVWVRPRAQTAMGVKVPGFLFQASICLNKTSGGGPMIGVVPEGAIVKVSCWPDNNGADVSVNWWGVLVPA